MSHPELERDKLVRARRMRAIMFRLEGKTWAEIGRIERVNPQTLLNGRDDAQPTYRVHRALQALARARQI